MFGTRGKFQGLDSNTSSWQPNLQKVVWWSEQNWSTWAVKLHRLIAPTEHIWTGWTESHFYIRTFHKWAQHMKTSIQKIPEHHVPIQIKCNRTLTQKSTSIRRRYYTIPIQHHMTQGLMRSHNWLAKSNPSRSLSALQTTREASGCESHPETRSGLKVIQDVNQQQARFRNITSQSKNPTHAKRACLVVDRIWIVVGFEWIRAHDKV